MPGVETLQRKQWVVAADLAAVDRVCAELAAWLAEHGLAAQRFTLEILAREALNNAVLHGGSQDPARQVRCDMEISAEAMRLQITDDGPGFDWQAALQRDLAAAEEDHGRGLALYRLYADTIAFNACGNSVVLVRRLGVRPGLDPTLMARGADCQSSTDENRPLDTEEKEKPCQVKTHRQ